MFALTRLIFCEPARSVYPSIESRINDVPHVRWSSDRSRSAIDGLDLGQDDAESARRALLRGHGFSAGRQDSRDCRSEIEVVPLAVNLWNAATGRAIPSIIRFELRPSNCARVIRADRLLLPSWYIPSGKLQSIGSSFMITAGRHPAVTFRSPIPIARKIFMPTPHRVCNVQIEFMQILRTDLSWENQPRLLSHFYYIVSIFLYFFICILY